MSSSKDGSSILRNYINQPRSNAVYITQCRSKLRSSLASPSTAVTASIRVARTSANSTDRTILSRVSSISIRIRLANTPVVTSAVLSIVGGIKSIPLLGIHSAVDSLGHVLIAKNIDNDLVANIRLGWRSRRVTGVVARLGSACCGASSHAVGEGLHLCEGEELVAHVGVGVCDWVIGSVDGAAEFDGATEAGLCCWSGVLVVTV